MFCCHFKTRTHIFFNLDSACLSIAISQHIFLHDLLISKRIRGELNWTELYLLHHHTMGYSTQNEVQKHNILHIHSKTPVQSTTHHRYKIKIVLKRKMYLYMLYLLLINMFIVSTISSQLSFYTLKRPDPLWVIMAEKHSLTTWIFSTSSKLIMKMSVYGVYKGHSSRA